MCHALINQCTLSCALVCDFLGSLGEFLQKASSLRLPLLVPKSVDATQQADGHSLLKFGMTAKKSHEVDSFSQHVHHLATLGSITQVNPGIA